MMTLVVAAALAACGGGTSQTEQPAPQPLPEAPWQGTALASNAVPGIYNEVWGRAANKSTCALVAFTETGQPNAVPRAATFSGGWAVAYDLPNLRSAFGIAGAGVAADGATYDAWPHKRAWSDGSSAGYGPEGGTGPNQLAYLRIAGQDCLYNVWSRISVAHLESLLQSIRFVR
jgi:hypothetical protein